MLVETKEVQALVLCYQTSKKQACQGNKTITNLPSFLRNRLAGRTNLLKIIKNMGWLVGDKILRLVAGVFVAAWLARYLGPEQFGVFSYGVNFVTLLAPLAGFWLDNLVLKELVKHPEKENQIIGTIFGLKTLGSWLIFGLCLAGVAWVDYGNSLRFWLVAVIACTVLLQPFEVIDHWFQSQINSKYTVYARNIGFLSSTGLKIVFILLNLPLMAFAALILAESVISVVGVLIIYRRKGYQSSQWHFDKNLALFFLKNGILLFVSALAVTIYSRIDSFMLDKLSGSYAVGIYAAAVRISEGWYFIIGAAISSTYPVIVKLKATDIQAYAWRLQELLNWLTLLAYFIAIALTLFSYPLIVTLYGDKYADAALILALHTWCGVFVVLGSVQTVWEVNEGLTELTMIRTLVGAFCKIGLNFLLIPPFGVVGSAIAMLISYAILCFGFNILYKKSYPLLKMQARALLAPLNLLRILKS